ncbi:hypothetical protein [Aquimarina sp. 2201CG5-10]|uniref:hypothetical protein n=1 Tax=Aquimarina callyspongiae TaxID=3098150 RepID=UPI002AB3574D|nr:hypothetical protein [Aquimarina sp. 2201CG5-10]MDY8135519.1 hypothetical protein [Aquimarina sp. 2201CG5-10]
MKRILFVITLMICINAIGQDITSTDFWEKDKIKHSIVSFGISTATYTYLSLNKKHKKLPELHKRLISLSTTILLGGLKEIMDSSSSNSVASWEDMGANAVGALAFQVTISIPLSFKSKNKKEENFGEFIK